MGTISACSGVGTGRAARPQLTIVTTMYRSVLYLREFHARVTAAAEQVVSAQDIELVYVNDGSPDDSLALAKDLHALDLRLVVLDLSRNFGHHRAILAGLERARGERVFLIDCDLEEPPEALVEFWNAMSDGQVDAVYGVAPERRRGPIDRALGDLYYFVYSHLSGLRITRNLLTVRLMSRRFVEGMLSFEEREFVLSGIWALTGFRQLPFSVVKTFKGASSYTLGHKIRIAVDSITSFSARPLVAIFYLGAIVAALAMAGAVGIAIDRMAFRTLQPGWSSLMVSIYLLGGLQLLCLGVIGVYIAKVFSEVKHRPRSIVREELRARVRSEEEHPDTQEFVPVRSGGGGWNSTTEAPVETIS